MGSAWGVIVRTRRTQWACTVLLVFALAGRILVQSVSSAQSQIYSAGTGEVQHVALDDGTHIYLNTRTSLEWRNGADGQRAMLRAGEAFFEVMPNAVRPFYVEAGEGAISVLGTSFNV